MLIVKIEMYFPKHIKYFKNHIWIQPVGRMDFLIGITDFVQHELGRIESLEIPNEGATVLQHEMFGTLFGNNSIYRLLMPFTGRLLIVNKEMEDRSELLNSDPYENWIALISVSDDRQLQNLKFLTAIQYEIMISRYGNGTSNENYQ